MIPVGPGEIPATGAELSLRVANVLGRVISSRKALAVTSEMASPDVVESFRLDVTGTECGEARMERPSGFTRLGAVIVQHLEVLGDPALVFGAPVTLKTNMENVPMSWSRDDKGNIWLVPVDSDPASTPMGGSVELAAAVSQLEQAARVAVAALAEQNGAKLKDLKLQITAAGPKAIAAKVDLAASKFMMTAKVSIIAQAALDDNLTLRIQNLEAKGDGAAGGMIANMLTDKLKGFRNREIPLNQFGFAGAAVQDIQLTVDEQIRLVAKFGQS